MKLRTKLLTTAAAGLSLTALAAGPAMAGDTTTSFAITGGALSVSAPTSANLSSAATTASSLTAQLGSVQVSDQRGALGGSWTTSVTSSDFTTGGATADETIAKSRVSYWSGAATASSGVATALPGQLLAINAQALSSSRTAFSASLTVGNNSTTWNPTIVVSVPSTVIAGTYSGTITHSVA
jgi:hypothetical protein